MSGKWDKKASMSAGRRTLAGLLACWLAGWLAGWLTAISSAVKMKQKASSTSRKAASDGR
jgi:hypothetical protein